MGLGTSLRRSGFISIRTVFQPFLTDQFQQTWQIRLDLRSVVRMALLEGSHGVQRPLQAQAPRLDLLDSSGYGKWPTLPAIKPFKKYGQAGIEMSEMLPNVGDLADDICIV